MSRLQELTEVLDHIELAWNRNVKAAMVMQIHVKGSAYRLPGTKMMMASDGVMHGTISGGCLESDLFAWAEKAMKENTPILHQYDLSENKIWGLGIGCKGNLEMFIMPIEPYDSFWLETKKEVQKQQSFTLILEIPTGRKLIVTNNEQLFGDIGDIPFAVVEKAKLIRETQTRAEIMSCNGIRYVIDSVKPSERLIVAGAGKDAQPVVNLAKKAGFSVTVLDARKDFNNNERFPLVEHLRLHPDEVQPDLVQHAWWVVMNHHQELDEATLKLSLNSQAKYIGMLGPVSRTEEMLNNIRENFDSGPIRSPIGLNLGAETMDEVAISIVSELMAKKNAKQPLPLHGKVKIHD